MLQIAYIIYLLNIVFAYSNDSPLRIHKRIKRIADKEYETTANNVPYLVRLDYNDEFGKHFLCSGALIHPYFVITAAHCVAVLPNDTITVSANLTYAEPRRITNISTPREYGENFKDYDIAILKIDPPFQTKSQNIRPIELCDTEMKPGDKLQVSGFQRQLANSTYMSWRLCNKYYKGKANLTRNMFCGLPEIQSSVCSRDAGGPVIHNGKLCGIMLWSSGWIESQYPEVYMSTKSIRRFIEHTLASR